MEPAGPALYQVASATLALRQYVDVLADLMSRDGCCAACL
jgi:hypothetical protein